VIARRVAGAFADAGRAVAARPASVSGAPATAQTTTPGPPMLVPVVATSGITVTALAVRPDSGTRADSATVLRLVPLPLKPDSSTPHPDSAGDSTHAHAFRESLGASQR